MLNISLGYMSIVSTKLYSSFRVSYRSNNLFFYSIWISYVHGCINLGGTQDTSSLANKTKTLQITSIISEGTICGMWKGIQTKATMQPSILGYSVESRKVLIFSSLTFRKSHYFSELNFFYLILCMYIQYVDLVLGIYMIYPSLHCECQLHYRASQTFSAIDPKVKHPC